MTEVFTLLTILDCQMTHNSAVVLSDRMDTDTSSPENQTLEPLQLRPQQRGQPVASEVEDSLMALVMGHRPGETKKRPKISDCFLKIIFIFEQDSKLEIRFVSK